MVSRKKERGRTGFLGTKHHFKQESTTMSSFLCFVVASAPAVAAAGTSSTPKVQGEALGWWGYGHGNRRAVAVSSASKTVLWGHSRDPFLSIDDIFFLLTVLSQPVSVQGAEFSFPLMVLKKLLRNQNTFQSYPQGLLWFKWFL